MVEIEGEGTVMKIYPPVKMFRELEKMLANSGLQECVDGRKGNRRLTGE